MSPSLSGVTARDNVQSAELLRLAFALCRMFLKEGGDFVAKAFPCSEVDEVFKSGVKSFAKLLRTNLKSSRNTSNELYIIGHGFCRGNT
jgi:23S rRNA (uridine2552-2'-O)-methyltransferase